MDYFDNLYNEVYDYTYESLTESKRSNIPIRKQVKRQKKSGSDIFKYARRVLVGAGFLIVLLRLIRVKIKKIKAKKAESKELYEKEISLCDQLIERITSKKEKMEDVVSKAKKKKERKKTSLANTINDLDQTEEYKNILKSGKDIKTVGLDIMKMAEKYNVPVDSRLSAILNSL